MKNLCLLLAFAATLSLKSAEIDSRYQVVLADQSIVTETEAAQTVAADLSLMFGKKIKVIAEKDYKKERLLFSSAGQKPPGRTKSLLKKCRLKSGTSKVCLTAM